MSAAPYPPPAFLCRENPNRLVSLWDMLRFHADVFIEITNLMGKMTVCLQCHHDAKPEETLPNARRLCELLKNRCQDLDLPLTAVHAERLAKQLSESSPSRALIGSALKEMNQRLCDELESRMFVQIETGKVKLYSPSSPAFGQSVFDQFASSITDVLEAGNCLALDRNTAAVFHLMRVLEAGLKVLAKELSIPYAPSWESYLKQLAKIIESDWKSKSTADQKKQPFYKDVLGDLQAIKIAWRNPTMHIVKSYGPDEAEHIYGCVKQFMVRLASSGLTE